MVSTPEQVAVPDATMPGPPRRPTPRQARWGVGAFVLLPAAVWLVVRPTSPQGIAAVVDLVVLPAVLFAEVRALVGRPSVSPSRLGVFFGLGAVFSAVASLVLERAVGLVADRPALHVAGALVEAAAVCAPLLVVAMAGGRKARLTVADMTLAGLASGLGFLVVQTSLATASLHAGPEYVNPLLAGFQRVPASAGNPPAYFVGSAIAAALVGFALGFVLRWPRRPLRMVLPGMALALVVFDHALFDWRLRHLVTGKPARTSGLVDVVQQVTLQGRLTLVLLAAGLIATGVVRAGLVRSSRPTVDLRDEGGDPGPGGPDTTRAAPETGGATWEHGEHGVHGVDGVDGVHGEHGVDGVDGAEGVDEGEDGSASATTGVSRAWATWVAPAAALAVGSALTWLARSRHIGFLNQRPLALAVAAAGLGYGLWHLPAGRFPDDGGDARLLLGAAAVASSALGVLCAFLPAPDALVPAHGSLFVETVYGWAAHVGNLGLLLGLGGFAAPAGGHVQRRFGDRWNAALLRRLGWTGWSAAGRTKGRYGGRYERTSKRRREGARDRTPLRVGTGQFLWFKLSGGRLGKLLDRRGKYRAIEDRAGFEAGAAVVIAIQPIYRPPSRVEFAGASVQEAIEAAMRAVGVDLAHNSLQLIDQGSPPKPGKPGSGRPARVRVAEAGDDAGDVLVPPGRDSIVSSASFVVSLEIAGEVGHEPAQSVNVTVRAARARRAGARVLSCHQTDASPERVRYRSNPYSPERGEDATMARIDAGDVVPAGGTRVENGAELVVEYRGEQAVITVYDSWVQQVIGVNRRLLDLTAEHHSGLIAELEDELAEAEAGGEAGDDIRWCIRRLEARLASVAQGHRLLTGEGDASGQADDDATAFMSTAVLHAAMSVEDANDMAEAATVALEEHRAAADEDSSSVVYLAFLHRTAPGRLWAEGAYSVGDVAHLLEWDRFSGPA